MFEHIILHGVTTQFGQNSYLEAKIKAEVIQRHLVTVGAIAPSRMRKTMVVKRTVYTRSPEYLRMRKSTNKTMLTFDADAYMSLYKVHDTIPVATNDNSSIRS